MGKDVEAPVGEAEAGSCVGRVPPDRERDPEILASPHVHLPLAPIDSAYASIIDIPYILTIELGIIQIGERRALRLRSIGSIRD